MIEREILQWIQTLILLNSKLTKAFGWRINAIHGSEIVCGKTSNLPLPPDYKLFLSKGLPITTKKIQNMHFFLLKKQVVLL